MADKKRRLWPRLLLGVSLALNLLVVGVVAGGLLSRDGRPDGRGGARDAGMFALIVMLPQEERRVLRGEIDQRTAALAGDRMSVAQQTAALLVALRADPFDPSQFQAVLADRRKARDAWAEVAETALTEQITGLDTAQRQEYAKRLERWSRNRHRRSHEWRERRKDD